MKKKKPVFVDVVLASRKMRRTMVIAILIYSAILVGFIAYTGRNQQSNKILESIVACSYTLCGTVVTAYMATSSYQDRNYILKKPDDVISDIKHIDPVNVINDIKDMDKK
jgi:hypothetical protein